MKDSTKQDILKLIIAATRAYDEQNDETVGDLVRAVGDSVAELNVAHAFALGLMIGAGGGTSGSINETNLMISIADKLGDQVEEARAAGTPPKGSLLN